MYIGLSDKFWNDVCSYYLPGTVIIVLGDATRRDMNDVVGLVLLSGQEGKYFSYKEGNQELFMY